MIKNLVFKPGDGFMKSPKTYDENEIPDYFNQDFFSWKNRYYMTSNGHNFFVLDMEKNEIEDVTVERIKSDSGTEESIIESGIKTIAFFSVEDFVEYKPFLEEIVPMYKFRLKYGNSIKEIPPKTFQEAALSIKNTLGTIPNPEKTREILNKLIILLRHFGLIKISNEPPYPGFFKIEDKLVSTVDYEMPKQSELQEALKELHKFSGYFEEFKEQLNFTLQWNILAPFSFYRKQNRRDRMGLLYMYGSHSSGKTSIAMLGCHIWDQKYWKQLVGSGMIHSAPNFGYHVNQSTFPIVLEDGWMVFRKKLLDTFEKAVYGIYARMPYNSFYGKLMPVPALAPMIIATTENPPENDYIGEDLHVLEFKIDKFRTENEMSEFSQRFNPENDNGPLRKLKAIGAFTANYIKANPEIMDMPWKEAAEVVWRAIYEVTGMEMPSWMNGCAGDAL